jgi:hypothetical protein
LASRRQAAPAPAAKLIGQRDLLPFGVAEDVRTKLASVTIVQAKDLFPTCDGLREQVVNWAWHGISRLALCLRLVRRRDPGNRRVSKNVGSRMACR